MTTNTQYGFVLRQSFCSGCKTCQVICKEKFDAEPTMSPRRVYEYTGGSSVDRGDGTVESNVFAYYTSISCNHCSEPVCVKACPTGAMFKRAQDGIVKVDQSICIGCESCSRACPYDAPQIDPRRKVMTKCDGCIDEVQLGRQPRCVRGCPQRALDFGPMDELRAKYPEAVQANIAPMPSSSITNPNFLIIPSTAARPSGSQEGKIENPAEV